MSCDIISITKRIILRSCIIHSFVNNLLKKFNNVRVTRRTKKHRVHKENGAKRDSKRHLA